MQYEDGTGPYRDIVKDDLYEDGETPIDPITSQPKDYPRDPINRTKFISYRGSEQHGVAFEPDTLGPTRANMYAAEQHAFETYTDPNITPRDPSPIRPLAVQVVDTPDLLYRRFARATTHGIPQGDVAWRQILQADPNRKRVIIRARTTGGFYGFMLCPEQSPSDIQSAEVSGGSGIEVLDTESTSPLWVRAILGDGELRISVWTEYLMYDGQRIMDEAHTYRAE